MPSSSPTRRELLGLGGTTLALLTGCLGTPTGPGDESPTTEQTPATGTTDDTTTTTTSEPADVTVSNVQITPEFVALDSPDSIGTFGDRDEQFVIVTVLVDGESGPPVEAFELSADGQTFDPTLPENLPSYTLWSRGDPYEGKTSGYLVFSVPKPLEAPEMVVRGPGAQFELGADARSTLARPPTDFSVSEVSAPERVESGSDVTLTATITNTGSEAGTFVGAFNRSGPLVAYTPVKRVEAELAAGESTTWTYSYIPSLDGGTESRPMSLYLNWRGGSVSTETTVEPPS
ncbi:CARDB domain-containing protein [Haloferax larsenii]|uniref:CARDB protein n=1 Tax=Haloferax larsenii TaxID=302484 RepID=A0A1H7HUR3_HALLR|nr:CARDB domain-containing protein [Haloferax larsenii]SEK54019.1 CARDB protein [Haloferax larsenii]